MKHGGESIGKNKFRTVALPQALIDRISQFVGDDESGFGYSTIPEFIKEAVRIRLDELEQKNQLLKKLKKELMEE
jgi:Arc/MetJ-type ribon-helix-helix transcriptional regulator